MFSLRKVYYRGMRRASSASLAAFVLAGGKSSRMGTDKAFLEYQGRTLLARAIDLSKSVSGDVKIVGSLEKFGAYGPVVEDVFSECGPLGGIHAALTNSVADLNLILAVDMPFVHTRFLKYLISQASGVNYTVVIPRSESRLQPLSAVYRRGFATIAEQALLAGRNKIGPLFGSVNVKVIDENELKRAGFSRDLFRNLNTPQELEETIYIKAND
jgi:molybdopterin-guanine dinucleotide biosynthesis protein A